MKVDVNTCIKENTLKTEGCIKTYIHLGPEAMPKTTLTCSLSVGVQSFDPDHIFSIVDRLEWTRGVGTDRAGLQNAEASSRQTRDTRHRLRHYV